MHNVYFVAKWTEKFWINIYWFIASKLKHKIKFDCEKINNTHKTKKVLNKIKAGLKSDQKHLCKEMGQIFFSIFSWKKYV